MYMEEGKLFAKNDKNWKAYFKEGEYRVII